MDWQEQLCSPFDWDMWWCVEEARDIARFKLWLDPAGIITLQLTNSFKDSL